MDQNLTDLPIDQFTRQAWAARFIALFRQPGQEFNVLDVGGYKGKTKEFLPQDSVTICDLFDVKEPDYVQVDGKTLPFADGTYDFVMSFDAYEHVPREQREMFIAEMQRVAKYGIILAAPFDTPAHEVSNAEKALNAYHQDLYEKDHPWLKEHIDYKIPQKTELEKILATHKLDFASMPSNDLSVWVVIQSLYFSIDLDPELRGRIDDVNRYYNTRFTQYDIPSGVAYRQLYFMSADAKHVAKVRRFIEAKQAAAGGTSDFVAYALATFGKKYRDVVGHDAYLEKELANRTQELEASRKELAALRGRLAAFEESRAVRLSKRVGAIKRRFKRGSI